MSTMPLRTQIEAEAEAVERQYRRRLAAIPDFPTIQIDPELVDADEVLGLAYAYFPGFTQRSPCALIAISTDPDRLPTERWCRAHPPLAARLDTTIGAALAGVTRRIGRSNENGRRLADVLRSFGIDRDPRTYLRDRDLSLTAAQLVVAAAIADCFADVLDPGRDPGRVRGFVYDRDGRSSANVEAVSRLPGGYRAGHGHAL